MKELTEEVLQRIAVLEEENAQKKSEITPIYTQIGQLYYEKPEGYEEELTKKVKELDEKKERIHQNYLTCLELKGLCLCANCGSEVELDATFCGECGSRMKATEEPDENSKICGRCGAKNGKEKKFCTNCGQKLEASEVFSDELENAEDQQELENALAADVMDLTAASVEVTEVEAEPALTKCCPSCGTRLPEEAIFCAECGLRL